MPSKPGDPWVICDLTGVKVRMSQTRKTWDGLRVWSHVWYPKQPLLSIRAIPDNPAVYDARPEPTPVYIRSGGYLVEPYLMEPQGYLGPAEDYVTVPAPTWDDMV